MWWIKQRYHFFEVHPRRGASLIELLLAMSLFAVMLPALMTGFVASREGKAQQEERYQATLLMTEAEDAVRSIREAGWSGISTNGTYHPVVSGTSWQLQSGAEMMGGFQRQVVISSVNRNSSGAIVTSGGTVDPSTKRVVVSVSWSDPSVSLAESTMYLTRYLENLAFTHTTTADFELAGHLETNTVINSDNGGQIVLGTSGPGRSDWCQPSATTTLDLPGQGAARGITGIPFQSFIGTGGNASGLPLMYVTVNDNHPPVAVVAGQYNSSDKANDVFGDTGYAYFAADTNSKEMVIVNTATMTESGTFDAPGNSDGVSVYVSGNVGYLVAGSTLYTIDVSSKTGARSQLGSVELAGISSSLFVQGGYAYIAINGTSNQLQIVNVSNPASMSVVGSLTVAGQNGRDVHVSADGNQAYLVTSTSASQSELFIINTTTKGSPSVISSYDTNGMDPQAVTSVLNDRRVLVVGTGGEEYQVVTIANITNPTRCGGLNDDSGYYGVAGVLEPDSDAYAFVSTGNTSAEFKIIEGGPGSTNSTAGIYESGIVESSTEAAFNGFLAGVVTPANTTVRYQVAVADRVAGSCTGANYVFVGSDGTSNSYFTSTTGSYPFDDNGSAYENPGRCFKYKVFLDTTDEYTTPIFQDITINYSP